MVPKVEKQFEHDQDPDVDSTDALGASGHADTDDIGPISGLTPPPLPTPAEKAVLNAHDMEADAGRCYIAIGSMTRKTAQAMLVQLAQRDETLNCLLWNMDEERWEDVFPTEARSGDSAETDDPGDIRDSEAIDSRENSQTANSNTEETPSEDSALTSTEPKERSTLRITVEPSLLKQMDDQTMEIDIVRETSTSHGDVMQMVEAANSLNRNEDTQQVDQPEIYAKNQDTAIQETESTEKTVSPAEQVQLIDRDQEAPPKVMPTLGDAPVISTPTSAALQLEEALLLTENEKREFPSANVNIAAAFSTSREDTSPLVINNDRTHHRVRFKLSVTLCGSSNFWTGVTCDISCGGLFVATYNILPLGTKIDVTFTLPDGKGEIYKTAEVRWLREFQEGLELPPGMGIKFVDLSNQDQERINSFVKSRETILFEE